jgi:glutamate--cysteine ligase
VNADLGAVMMTSTAGVQVNLDAGADPADVARRWRLLHLLGPTLSAAFANSPIHRGALTGWRSTRQAVWLRLDPSRTSPPPSGDPGLTWSDYVLAAPVMMLRTASLPWLPAPGFTFGDWVGGRVGDLAPPTEHDLDYHLTTLFPPVRPRGWFEVRYLDAQDPRWWTVPVVVLATVLEHPEIADAVTHACEPVADSWLAAARHGLGDPALARAAQTVFASVLPVVQDAPLQESVADFASRYVGRGRCPADDVLDGAAPAALSMMKQKELR